MLDVGYPDYAAFGWTAKDAVRIARIAEKHGIFFLVEPLKPDDVDGFARLTANTNIKIASGECLTARAEFVQFIGRRAVDIIQPDAQQIGITQLSRWPTAPSGPASSAFLTVHGHRWLWPPICMLSAGRPMGP